MASERPTLPSLQTPREQIEAAISARRISAIPEIPDLLEARARARDEIDQQPLIPEEKQKRQAALDVGLHQQKEAVLARAIRAATKSLDDEAGAIHASTKGIEVRSTGLTEAERAAEARADARRVHLEARAQTLAVQVAQAITNDDVDQIFADAAIIADDELIRTVGRAALRRKHDLAMADKHKSISAARDAYLQFQHKFSQWERTHPGPSVRLAQIEREKATVATLLRVSADHMCALYGIGRVVPTTPTLRSVPEVPPSRSDLVFGKAFDRLDAVRDALTNTRGRR